MNLRVVKHEADEEKDAFKVALKGDPLKEIQKQKKARRNQ